MAVKVVDKTTGETYTGKFARIAEGSVNLFSGIMSDKKGGFRGCGRKQVFEEEKVTVTADEPEKEVKKG